MLSRILLTTDAVGGVWRYSIELARGLASIGVEIVLAVLGPVPDSAQLNEASAIPGLRLLVTGLPLDWLAETPDELESAAQALARLASRVCADTVQLHAPALVGQAIWPVPVIAVAHSCVGTWWQGVRGGPIPSNLAWRAAATATGIDRADGVVTPSYAFADALRACYGTRRSIDVVWNARTPMRAQAQRRRHVLTVGRLWDAGKNLAALDAAAAEMNCPVQAAGPTDGPNGAQVHCRHLRMLGSLDTAALADAYARASVFVSVALYEPFGLAVLEAAQAGCPLVLSDIPTFRELWDGAAVFVPPDDTHRIASAIRRLLTDRDHAARRGQAAQRRAARFDVPAMADATWKIHDRVAARDQTAA